MVFKFASCFIATQNCTLFNFQAKLFFKCLFVCRILHERFVVEAFACFPICNRNNAVYFSNKIYGTAIMVSFGIKFSLQMQNLNFVVAEPRIKSLTSAFCIFVCREQDCFLWISHSFLSIGMNDCSDFFGLVTNDCAGI